MQTIFEAAMEALRRGEVVVVHHQDIVGAHSDAPGVPHVTRGLAVTWCPEPTIGANPADDPPCAQSGAVDENEAQCLLAGGADDERDPRTEASARARS